MNSGLYAFAGASATATAAACANRLLDPITNVSKVYFGLSLVSPGLGWPAAAAPAGPVGCRTGGIPFTPEFTAPLPGRACPDPLADPESRPTVAGRVPGKPPGDGDVPAGNVPRSCRGAMAVCSDPGSPEPVRAGASPS